MSAIGIRQAACTSPATPLCPSSCQLSPATNSAGPQFVTWAPDSNIAPLATAYIFTDDSGQSTSSSLTCNSDLFSSAYSTTLSDCSYSICPSQYLDPDCNLYINSLVINQTTSVSPTVQIQTASSGYWLNLGETYGASYVTTTAYNRSCNLGCSTSLGLFVASVSPLFYSGALTSLSDNTYYLPDITNYADAWIGFSCPTVALDQPVSFAAGLTTTITAGDGATSTSAASSGPTIPVPSRTSSLNDTSSSSPYTSSTSSTDSEGASSSASIISITSISTETVPGLSSTSYSPITVTSYTDITLPNGQSTSSALTLTSTIVVIPQSSASPSLQQTSFANPLFFSQIIPICLIALLVTLA